MWNVIDRDEGSPLLHIASYLNNLVRPNPIVNLPPAPFAFEFKNRWVRYALDVEEFKAEGRQAVERLKDPAFLDKVDKGQRKAADELIHYSDPLRDRVFTDASAEELGEMTQELYRRFEVLNLWGHVINLPDFVHSQLSDEILERIEAARARSGASISAAEAFGTLATPTELSMLQEQDRDLYRLVALVQADSAAQALFTQELPSILARLSKFPAIQTAVTAHARRYDWLQFHYDGPTILDERYFIDLVRSEIHQGTNGAARATEMTEALVATAAEQEKVSTELGLGADDRYWVQVAKTSGFLKGLRKETTFRASRHAERLFRELGRRLSLSRFQIRHLLPSEIARQLLGESVVSLDDVNARMKHSVWMPRNGELVILTGSEAQQISAVFVEDEVATELNELTGSPAFVGTAKGVVRLILRADDMPKMNQGDILVSMATNPNVVPAMKKAAAIITDVGGVTCHAAIMSRELKIPCVIGTKVATRWLKDGDLVEVDAHRGIVRKLTTLN